MILEVVRAQPDATFVELQVVLEKRGIRTSRSALWRFFGRHDITFKKKSLCASERQRQDVVRARRKWIREQGLLDPARLVFIDETSVNTQMVRLYGHGPRGVRLVDHVPLGNRKTFTFVAALRHNRMVAPLLIDGAMNGETFRAYIEQFVVYPVHVITRKSLALMMRKLSVTESHIVAQLRGTFSRRKPSVASANWATVA